jgi:type III secretion system YscD/HrpQ family protein
MAEQNLILRIFSGPHNGAEIPVNPNNDFIIGKDDECDFVFNDQSLASRQLKIRIQDKKLFIELLEGEVFVNSKKIENKEFQSNFYDIITVGLTSFAIGQANEKWAELKIPSLFDLQTETKEEDITKHNPENLSEKLIQKEEKKTETVVDKALKKNIFSNSKFVILFVIFFVLSIFLGSFFLLQKKKSNKAQPKDPVETISAKISEFGMNNINLSKDSSGRILIKGYVKDQAEKEKLKQNCFVAEKNLTFNVLSETDLLSAIKETFDAFGMNLEIENNGNGIFSVYGVVENAQKLQNIISNLKGDVSGIKEIADKTMSLTEIKGKLEKMIANFEASDAIKVVTKNKEFFITGELKKNDFEKWNKFFKENIENIAINVKLNNEVRIKEDLRVNQPLQANLPLQENQPVFVVSDSKLQKIPVLSVTIGKFSYITTTEGNRLFKGAYINNQYKIKDIKETYIVLEKDNLEYIYPIKGD